MIRFRVVGDALILVYESVYPSVGWVSEKFRSGNTIWLRRCFTLENNDLVEPLTFAEEEDVEPPEELEFVIGKRVGDYFRLDRRVIGTNGTCQ